MSQKVVIIDGGLSTELSDLGYDLSVYNWNQYYKDFIVFITVFFGTQGSKLWTAKALINDPDVLKQAHIKFKFVFYYVLVFLFFYKSFLVKQLFEEWRANNRDGFLPTEHWSCGQRDQMHGRWGQVLHTQVGGDRHRRSQGRQLGYTNVLLNYLKNY
jgi:hypothetical protein